MARRWNDHDEQKYAAALSVPVPVVTEPIEVDDLLVRDLLLGTIAYLVGVLRARLILDEPATTLASAINGACRRRSFMAWIAEPIPDIPEHEDSAVATGG
jgi:hypothetical protein